MSNNDNNNDPKLYIMPTAAQFNAFYTARTRLYKCDHLTYSRAMVEFRTFINILNGADANHTSLRPDPTRNETWAQCIGEINCEAVLFNSEQRNPHMQLSTTGNAVGVSSEIHTITASTLAPTAQSLTQRIEALTPKADILISAGIEEEYQSPSLSIEELLSWYHVSPDTLSPDNLIKVQAHRYAMNHMTEPEALAWEGSCGITAYADAYPNVHLED
jgi:hypothetical protein